MKARASGMAASTGSCSNSAASAWKSRSARARDVFAAARTRSTVSSSHAPSCAQRVPQEFAEKPHVLPQPFVRIGLHGLSISIEEDAARRDRHFCRDRAASKGAQPMPPAPWATHASAIASGMLA